MSLAVRLAVWLLQRPLTAHDHNLLTTAILDRLGVLPFSAIIKVSEAGEFLVNGKPIEVEQARALQEGAKLLLNNPTLRIIFDQVAYAGTDFGVYKAENELQMIFTKAIFWWSQEVRKLLNQLAGS